MRDDSIDSELIRGLARGYAPSASIAVDGTPTNSVRGPVVEVVVEEVVVVTAEAVVVVVVAAVAAVFVIVLVGVITAAMSEVVGLLELPTVVFGVLISTAIHASTVSSLMSRQSANPSQTKLFGMQSSPQSKLPD